MKKILNSFILATFLAACTDYVQQIDDRYNELKGVQSQITSSSGASLGDEDVLADAVEFMTDSRDGQTYKVVTIGTQIWMAQNLNYQTENSCCFNDSASYCNKYGRLYTWSAAMDSAGIWSSNGKGCGYKKDCSPTYPVRGVCPSGWHVPTKEEFEILISTAGGQRTAGYELKSTSAWGGRNNGSDAYGFSAEPSGSKISIGFCCTTGAPAYFWSSSEYTNANAFFMNVNGTIDEVGLGVYDPDDESFFFSVRCLKDEEKTERSSPSVTPQSNFSETKVSSSTMVDSRDSKIYKTITIGTQTWMAENLNYETGNSYCYGDDARNCAKYGRLYTWAAAMDSAGIWSKNGEGCGITPYGEYCSPIYPVQGVCPGDWHLPTQAEFDTLIFAVGGFSMAGKMLKSTSGWYNDGNGMDAYAFSALSAGYRDDYGNYKFEGSDAVFWSSTQNDFLAYYMKFRTNFDDASEIDVEKFYAFSVRCVKDN